MKEIKKIVRELINQVKIQKEKIKMGLSSEDKTGLHLVITGNPGTGKTTVARKLGEIFHAIGFLSRGHIVEVDRSKLVGQFVGETPKLVTKLCDEAQGGILFIDEAYTLAPDNEGSSDPFGKEAIETLMKRMEDDRGNFIVIAAGYKEEMERFLNVNPGLRSRFDRTMHFEDYNPEELYEIFVKMSEKKGYKLKEETVAKLKEVFLDMYSKRDRKFANGREVRKLFETAINELSTRLTDTDISEENKEVLITFLPEDIKYELKKEITIEEVIGELTGLVGMENIKREIKDLLDTINIQKKRAETTGKEYKLGIHFVITGNPGTGKTTVARILGKVFKAIGLLSRGHIVEVDRKDLVGQYVGSTPKKTNNKIEEAMGGILFIDEAYTLSQQGAVDTFGREAIETLLKRMEDDRGKFIVIAAGYPEKMNEFLESNPGLKSRFNRFFLIEDYTGMELYEIFKVMSKSAKYEIEPETEKKLKKIFLDMYENRSDNFANGREVRNLFEKCLSNQARRLTSAGNYDEKELMLIKQDDLPI